MLHARVGAGTVPWLLHPIHCLPARENAIGEPLALGLSAGAQQQQQHVEFKQSGEQQQQSWTSRSNTNTRCCLSAMQLISVSSFYLCKEPITLSQPPVYFGGAEYLSGVGTGSGAAADASDFSSIQGITRINSNRQPYIMLVSLLLQTQTGAYNIQNSASASESSFSSLNGGAVNHPSVVGDGNAAPSASAINSASTPSSSSTSSDIVAQIGHAHNSNAVAGADLPALLEPNNSQQHSTGSQQQQLHLQATQLHQQHEQHLQQQQQQLLAHAAAASSSANAAAAAAAAAALLTPHMLGQTGLGQMGCTGGGLGLGDPYASECHRGDEEGCRTLIRNENRFVSPFRSAVTMRQFRRRRRLGIGLERRWAELEFLQHVRLEATQARHSAQAGDQRDARLALSAFGGERPYVVHLSVYS